MPTPLPLLTLMLACQTEPAPTPTAVEPLDLDLSGADAQLPWLKPSLAFEQAGAQDPRQAADQAFNAAMQAYETGDTVTASTAIPAALDAYQAVPELDADGRFHVAVLLLSAGDGRAAMSQADRILQDHDTHLLALGIGARAAMVVQDTAAARAYAQRTLAAYPAEQGALPEYGHHGVILPRYLAEAQGLLATDGLR